MCYTRSIDSFPFVITVCVSRLRFHKIRWKCTWDCHVGGISVSVHVKGTPSKTEIEPRMKRECRSTWSFAKREYSFIMIVTHTVWMLNFSRISICLWFIISIFKCLNKYYVKGRNSIYRCLYRDNRNIYIYLIYLKKSLHKLKISMNKYRKTE